MGVGGRLRQLGTRRLRAFSSQVNTAFSPTVIPGLVVWYDASDASSLTIDGSNNVSQISDKSGNSRHATQPTTLNQPKYVTNTYNGRAAIRGDGTNTWMSFNGPDLSSSAGYTVVAVGGIGSSTASGIYAQFPSSGSGNGIALWTGIYRTGRTGTAITFPTGNSTIQGVPFSFIYRNDGTKTTANTKVLATWNASERVGTTTQNASTPAAGTAYLAAVAAGDSPLQDKLCEFLIFDRQITDEERDALYAYLTAKWMPVYSAPPVSSGLALWLDAADATTINLDSSNNVITWLDKSGNARHATQATTTQRPSYTSSNQINGINTPRFDGTDDRLSVAHDAGLALPSYTIFGVVDNDSTGTAFRAWIEKSANASPTDRKLFVGTNQDIGSPWSPANMVVVADQDSTSAGGNGIKQQSGSANTSPVVVTSLKDSTVAAYLYVNGSLAATTLTPNNNSANSSVINIGGSSYPWLGKVAEVLVYNRAVNSTERETIESYLRTKWQTTLAGSLYPAMWLDASDASTITKDGSDFVSQWRDKSGNGRHANQATGSLQPKWISNGINGQPAIVGDGIDDRMLWTAFTSGTNHNFYVVAQFDTGINQWPLAGGFFGSDTLSASWSVRLSDTSANPAVRLNVESPSEHDIEIHAASTSPNPKSGVAAVYSFLRNGGLYRAKWTHDPIVSRTYVSGTRLTGVTNTNMIFRGWNSFASSSFRIAEVVCFEHDLSVAEEAILSAYFTSKYGVGI